MYWIRWIDAFVCMNFDVATHMSLVTKCHRTPVRLLQRRIARPVTIVIDMTHIIALLVFLNNLECIDFPKSFRLIPGWFRSFECQDQSNSWLHLPNKSIVREVLKMLNMYSTSHLLPIIRDGMVRSIFAQETAVFFYLIFYYPCKSMRKSLTLLNVLVTIA